MFNLPLLFFALFLQMETSTDISRLSTYSCKATSQLVFGKQTSAMNSLSGC